MGLGWLLPSCSAISRLWLSVEKGIIWGWHLPAPYLYNLVVLLWNVVGDLQNRSVGLVGSVAAEEGQPIRNCIAVVIKCEP